MTSRRSSVWWETEKKKEKDRRLGDEGLESKLDQRKMNTVTGEWPALFLSVSLSFSLSRSLFLSFSYPYTLSLSISLLLDHTFCKRSFECINTSLSELGKPSWRHSALSSMKLEIFTGQSMTFRAKKSGKEKIEQCVKCWVTHVICFEGNCH